MARLKLDLPTFFPFKTSITVRIDDINYGGHMGNDSLLSFIHEARLRFFQSLGGSELSLFGTSVIMGDAAVIYKSEVFQGQELCIEVTADEFTTYGFDLYYKVSRHTPEKEILVAQAKTGMVCFNYTERKMEKVPEELIESINKLKKTGIS